MGSKQMEQQSNSSSPPQRAVLPDLESIFPDILETIFQKIYHSTIFHKKFNVYPSKFKETCASITKLIPEWEGLSKQSNRKVVFHTYRMIYSLYIDGEFQKLSKADKNILVWCALLHDVKKLGTPILKCKDHCHPFKSGYSALLTFDSLGFVGLTKQEKEEWDSIFRNAYLPIKKEKANGLHNNEAAVPIFRFLNKIYGENNNPEDEWKNAQKQVILLITFHQSLYLLQEYPPATPLNKESTYIIFDSKLLDLMYLIAVHDSFSYLLFKQCKPSLKFLKQQVSWAIHDIKLEKEDKKQQMLNFNSNNNNKSLDVNIEQRMEESKDPIHVNQVELMDIEKGEQNKANKVKIL